MISNFSSKFVSHLLQSFNGEVVESVCFDKNPNGFYALLLYGEKLFRGFEVDSIGTDVLDPGGGDNHDYPLCTVFFHHSDKAAHRRPPYQRVVDQNDYLPFNAVRYGIKFSPYSIFPVFLAGGV